MLQLDFECCNKNTDFVAIRTQLDDHVKIRLTSQLIKGISKVLQKLLKYFSGTII